MTRGISEERLHEILKYMKSETNPVMWFTSLLSEVEELNQWKPIEQAPKDREILVSNGHQYFIGIWNTTQNCWVDDSGSINPTHWQELPKDPI